MQIIVDGLLTHYLKSGKGKTVVLLHGWGDNSSTFGSLSKELEKKYEVLALDFPGFGKSQRQEEAWGTPDYALFVANWLSKLQKKPYAIIGHSHGGAVAIYGCANKLFKPDKLVLLASAGIRAGKNSNLKVKVAKTLSLAMPKNKREKLRSRYYQSIGSEALLFPELEQSFRKVVAFDLLDSARGIDVPTLMIYGEHDTSTPPEYGAKYHRAIKNSKLCIINSGHFVHHDAGPETNKLINEFLG